MLSVRVLQGFSGHAQWCVVTSGEPHPSGFKHICSHKGTCKGLFVSRGTCCNAQFSMSQYSSPFPFVLLQQHLFQCSYKLCWWSETAVILGVLEWQSLVFVLIMLSNVEKRMVREAYTAVYYIYKIRNTVEYLQNSPQWSATESFTQVFAEAAQKSEW